MDRGGLVNDSGAPLVRDPVERLELAIGHRFTARALLLEALTHRSFVNEAADPGVRDNERLEFLGDAVIDLVVSAELMARFDEAREGQLSRLRAQMVNEGGLAEAARRIDLGSAIRLGRGEELSGGRERTSLLADAFEALMASIYLDAGLEVARDIVLQTLVFPESSLRLVSDPKTELQERMQAKMHVTPSYRVVAETGPDHDKTFVVDIVCDGEVLGNGSGRTKKEAERAAAAQVLETFGPDVEPVIG